MSKSNWKSLLFRDESQAVQKKEEGVAQTSPSSPSPQVQPISQPSTSASSVLIEDFVNRLQELIDKNNQPGFDFLEYLESLFAASQTPGAMEYQMVFNIAKKMNAGLSVPALLESSRTYKNLVENAATSTIADGQKKKETLKQELEGKRKTLNGDIESIGLQIGALEKQIEALKQDSITKTNQLAAIDKEYEPQFTDIDNKIGAMNLAKEKVISSIVDVEAGIQTHIK